MVGGSVSSPKATLMPSRSLDWPSSVRDPSPELRFRSAASCRRKPQRHQHAGLGTVAQGNMTGINVAGLGTVGPRQHDRSELRGARHRFARQHEGDQPSRVSAPCTRDFDRNQFRRSRNRRAEGHVGDQRGWLGTRGSGRHEQVSTLAGSAPWRKGVWAGIKHRRTWVVCQQELTGSTSRSA